MKKTKKKILCSICGEPLVGYRIKRITRYNEETNETKTEEVEICCLGHTGIHPSMWNGHPLYDTYAKQLAKQHRATGV